MQDGKRSKILQCDDISDLIHFEMKPYEKIHTYEAFGHENDSGLERGRTLVCVAIEPAEGQEDNLDAWYRKQHLDMLGMCRHYRRCTRYKRKDGVSPRFVALHEWDCEPEDIPMDQLAQLRATDWSREIRSGVKVMERDVFTLIQAQGNMELKL
ncbi:hypothetical protein F5Y18DRAFT_369102 [Xylariaceae sp. FL1019]|nr:hypothetical protein F5Y18DRAFT_369102 [Xylariaceae sp. FL1019]